MGSEMIRSVALFDLQRFLYQSAACSSPRKWDGLFGPISSTLAHSVRNNLRRALLVLRPGFISCLDVIYTAGRNPEHILRGCNALAR